MNFKDRYEIEKNNLDLFLYWITERYRIHLNKDIYKFDRPWTTDAILQEYSFTNVRRIEDRVTKYLLEQVCYNPELTLEEKVLNIIWFRIFNQPETFELFGFPILSSDLDGDFHYIQDKYTAMIPSGKVLARGAYMISGIMNATYEDVQGINTTMMPWHIIWKLHNDRPLFANLLQCINDNRGKDAFSIINGLRGIGEFIAYQIYIDLSYCREVPFTENDFVVLGGGAKRGVAIVCPTLPQKQYPQFIQDIQDDINDLLLESTGESLLNLMKDLPVYERHISLSNMQNCFCEFSKYYRYTTDVKKTKRRKYIPFATA